MTEDDATLHLTLKGRGISINRDVPDAVAAEVLRLLLGGPHSTPGGSGSGHALPPTGSPNAPHDSESLAELFQRHEPKRNPDKIAVIAFHLKARGRATFSKDDVRSGFRGAGEKEPGNFARDWDWSVRNGWIGGDAAQGFYLTRTGSQVVQSNFARDMIQRTKLRARKKPKKATP